MGSFTTKQLDQLLRLFRLPLEGSHKAKEERLNKFINALDPNARLVPPNCECPEPDSDADSLTPPPRNTPSSPRSPSTVLARSPTETTSGTATASTHPLTAATPSGTQASPPGKLSYHTPSSPPTLFACSHCVESYHNPTKSI